MTALVREGIEMGELRAEADPSVTAQLLLSLAGWMAAWYRPDGAMTPEELAHAVTTLALDGLTAPGPLEAPDRKSAEGSAGMAHREVGGAGGGPLGA